MNNFLQFVDEDIKAKKTLFSTMPTNTKSNIKKYNTRVEAEAAKYEEYRVAIKKYLDAKSKSFELPEKVVAESNNSIKELEEARFYLNPTNTYFEKMKFDTLFYAIDSYQDFKFNTITKVINDFIDKFESVGIILMAKDFDYTAYVKEFMTAFMEIRQAKSDNYDSLNEIFERIYWINPELVDHIKLNFRKLIKKHEKEFVKHIDSKKQQIAAEKNLDYDKCKSALGTQCNIIGQINENITDIIKLAKEGKMDINACFPDSKIRKSAFDSLMIEPINMSDKQAVEKFYDSLRKLKHNIKEYSDYIAFLPLFDDFKRAYASLANKQPEENKGAVKDNKDPNSVESQISSEESKLEKINGNIYNPKKKLFSKALPDTKELKFESVKIANNLNKLYSEYNDIYFKNMVKSNMSSTFTVADLLNLYYSYDFFKKDAIKRVFSLTRYEEVLKQAETFDKFATNPFNVIMNGMALFEDTDVASVIAKKYRLANINITEADLDESGLEVLLDRINLVLRVNEIENSETTVEKIWFMKMVSDMDKVE